jgi:hypothetical protein
VKLCPKIFLEAFDDSDNLFAITVHNRREIMHAMYIILYNEINLMKNANDELINDFEV